MQNSFSSKLVVDIDMQAFSSGVESFARSAQTNAVSLHNVSVEKLYVLIPPTFLILFTSRP